MARVRKFLDLGCQERCLLLHTLLLVVFLRAALVFLPFKQVNELLACGAARRRRRCYVSKPRVISAIRAASAFIPGSACLTQALVAKYQLERFGLNTQLHFGVAKEKGMLLAHAWLQCDGEVVIGGEIAPRFTPLLALN